MAKQIIKSDGKKMPVLKAKIDRSISRAANDAKLGTEEINKLVNEISDNIMQFIEAKDKVTTKEVKKEILAELDAAAPTVSAEWRKFDQKNNKK